MLNGLDAFTGIGGLTLGLGEWVNPVAYCERDRYCQAVLLSRMREGRLPRAPIWDDITTLRGEMLPEIDIIYGGFPCTDVSCAGRGKGLEGERSGLVFEMLRLVEECAPNYVFFENVPAIRTRGGERVARALASRGYDCRWVIVSAAEIGAPHLRKRWFCLAADSKRLKLWHELGRGSGKNRDGQAVPGNDGQEEFVADAESVRLQRVSSLRNEKQAEELRLFPTGPSESDRKASAWWATEPSVGRVADGVPARVDRIRSLGNAVVPAQAREAFKRLIGI